MELKSKPQDPTAVERLVAVQEQSGLSIREFAEQSGIAAEKLYEYRQRMKRKTSKQTSPSFSPVMSGKRITLELSNGKAITFAKEYLPEIITELSR